jgi:hypothetical protein
MDLLAIHSFWTLTKLCRLCDVRSSAYYDAIAEAMGEKLRGADGISPSVTAVRAICYAPSLLLA